MSIINPKLNIAKITYQEKFDELQEVFSEKFDAYEKIQKKLFLRSDKSDEFSIAKSEFEKSSTDFQNFLILFKENNASPTDEIGTIGGRCS